MSDEQLEAARLPMWPLRELVRERALRHPTQAVEEQLVSVRMRNPFLYLLLSQLAQLMLPISQLLKLWMKCFYRAINYLRDRHRRQAPEYVGAFGGIFIHCLSRSA